MSSPKCSKCNKTMVERTNRANGRKFWGCVAFPLCKGGYPVFEKLEKINTFDIHDFDKFQPSSYQQDIMDFYLKSNESFVINAVAGSGKTKTCVWLLSKKKSNNQAFICFDRKTADRNATKVPQGVYVDTLNALGKQNVNSMYKACKVDQNKDYNILQNYIKDEDYNQSFRITLKENANQIVKTVSLLKAYLLDPDVESIEFIQNRHSILIDSDANLNQINDGIGLVFYDSIDDFSSMSFDDQLYWSATGAIPTRKFEEIFVDESQDLTTCQIEMVKKSLTENGRLIAVGDPFQSIYGFRGTNTHAIDDIIKAFNAKVLYLSISYRCPKVIGQWMNEKFPYIKFEVSENAIEGILEENLPYYKFESMVKAGDLVLCRNTAPLIKPCFSLIAKGIKANIRGRDIGQNLIGLIAKISGKKGLDAKISVFVDDVESYRKTEIEKLSKKFGAEQKMDALNDQLDAILAIGDECQTINDIIKKIDSVFSDDKIIGVSFSTVHRAKGDESDNVFILRHDLMPSPKAVSDEDRQQEKNVEYVADTRVKENCYLVMKQ